MPLTVIEDNFQFVKIRFVDPAREHEKLYQSSIGFDTDTLEYVFTLYDEDGNFKTTRRYPQSGISSYEYSPSRERSHAYN